MRAQGAIPVPGARGAIDRHGLPRRTEWTATLADGGILFLDELPAFSRTILEVLRESLEHGTITLRRASEATTLTTWFRLVAAMTPYPWDEGDGTRRPTPEQVARYRARVGDTISPLMPARFPQSTVRLRCELCPHTGSVRLRL